MHFKKHVGRSGSEFFNTPMKSWLNDKDIEIYLILNEGKSAIAEKFIRTFKSQVCKQSTQIYEHR